MNKLKELKARIENEVAFRRAGCDSLAKDEAGMGTIEVVLIIVVLISLVIVFKKNINGVLTKVFSVINQGVESAATYE